MLLSCDTALWDYFERTLIDLDGVVFRGATSIAGAPQLLQELQSRAVATTFVTNNAARVPAEIVQRLAGISVTASIADVVTSAGATAMYLKENFPVGTVVLAVGSESLRDALVDAGFTVTSDADDRPTVVVVGFDRDVGWRQLAEATLAVNAGASFVVTNLDSNVPTERGLVPANGALAAVVQTATGVLPISIGKPSPEIYRLALGGKLSRTIAIGDRLDTDVAGAVELGISSLFVLSGAHGVRELLAAGPSDRPSYIGRDIAAMGESHPAVIRDGEAAWSCRAARVVVDDDGVLALEADDGLDGVRAACAAVWELSDAGTPCDYEEITMHLENWLSIRH